MVVIDNVIMVMIKTNLEILNRRLQWISVLELLAGIFQATVSVKKLHPFTQFMYSTSAC